MPTVNVRVLKDRLSSYLSRAEAGERIVVLRGGRAIAALVPVDAVPEEDEVSVLARLAGRGTVTLPRTGSESRFGGATVPARGRSAAAMVVEDRR